MPASADAITFNPAPRQIVCGRYELVSELGRGGMGSVWRARNVALDAPCAIKFMLPELALKDDLRQRFLREARAAAQLRSPHIVHVYDVGDWEGCPFMAMEFMDGENLEAVLERERKLPFPLALEVITQVADGLETAHARGLVHRDLKPANIFLLHGERTAVKILDFGVAKHTDATSGVKTMTGMLLGTPHYMSPEQARGESSLDRRADVWSLGIVAYQCLTGRLPFDGDSLPQLLGAILAGEIRGISVPELQPFWHRASQRDPQERYQTARELADGLRSAIGGWTPRGPVTEVPAESGVRPSDAEPIVPMRRDSRMAAIIVVAVALLGIAAFFAWSGEHPPADPAGANTALVSQKPIAEPPPKTEAPAPIATPPSRVAIDSQPSKVNQLPRAVPRPAPAAPPRPTKTTVSSTGVAPTKATLSGTGVAPKPRTPPAAAQAAPAPRPSERPQQRPERPRLGKYDDLIGF